MDLPNPGIEPGSPALQTDSLPTELSGNLVLGYFRGKSPNTVIYLCLLNLGRSLRPEMLFLFSLKIGNVEGSFASMKRKKGVQVRGLQGEYIQTSSHGEN